MIEINNLQVVFDNTLKALDNINIILKKQKCIGIIGENGSGKSTLLLSILKLVDYQGEIKINDLYVNKDTVAKIRALVGLVFQNSDHMLFLPTVYDNLAFGLINQGSTKQMIDDKIKYIAKQFEIEDLLPRMANHLSGLQGLELLTVVLPVAS